MADFHKGKRFLLLFLFVFIIILDVVISNEQHEDHHHEELEQKNKLYENLDSSKPLDIVDRQEIQLEKLENLVRNLTEAVARLELSSSDCRKKLVVVGSAHEKHEFESSSSSVLDPKPNGGDATDYDEEIVVDDDDDDKNARVGKKGQSVEGVSVTKYNPSWSERFRFLSAVKLESEATCINILPFEDYEGFSKYIAVGDERGTVYIFLLNGDVLVEFHTLSDSPITSMLSYMSIFKNESVLVTGHKDGVVLVHRVWEASSNGGEDWHSLSMKHLHAFPSVEKKGDEEEDSPITILEVHQVGRVRFILSSDLNGRIRVLRENGTVYGSATTKSRPLAFMRQRLLFLTEAGAGSLDLRSMTVRESECEGLNRSRMTNYVFDPSERSKGYGFTSDEDLVHVVLLGDMMNFKCRVRSKRKFEMHGPLAVQAIKGYLLVVNQGKVFVYNVSSQNYIRVGVPRPLFHASLSEIRSSFLSSHGLSDGSRRMPPLISSDHEKLVVLGLGSGYVGMYRSALPVFNPEFNTMLWTSPVLLFFLFLFGVWQFFGKKKESLTSWGSDDPFISTSVSTGGPSLGVGSDDRPFVDSTSRAPDLRDLRVGLRSGGPTRRYVSPSRYPGGTGAAIPFRPNTTDPNFRTSSTDHNFRATTELKYRAPSLEGAGFAKRREPLFSNSQVVEDNIE